MDIVVICNGLGNQMSQYAFYLSKKAIDTNTCFIFDRRSQKEHNGYELEKVFGITYKEQFFQRLLCFIFRILEIKKYPVITKPILKLLNLLGLRIIAENYDYDFKPDYLRSRKGLNFYHGGWHSELYFQQVQDTVKNTFRFLVKETTAELTAVIERIKTSNSIAVHVRRGDFLTGINYEMFGAVCTEAYFENAILEIKKNVRHPYFFVFTNDVDWVGKCFNGSNFEIVTCNRGLNSWRDMYLISLCNHSINSNSSFSWWGAWLNPTPSRKVIVPQFFLNGVVDKDVYPADWIKMPNF